MEAKGRFLRRTGVHCLADRYLVLMVVALVLGATLMTGMVVWAAESDLDPRFDADGIVTTDHSEFDQINDIVIQPDGKIVAAGHSGTFHGNSQEVNMMVARYNIDGSLDSTFGGDGIVTTNFFVTSKALAVALQTDGKIVVAGWAAGFLRRPFFAVVRYNTNGSLDETFSGGIIITQIGSSAQILDLAIQSDNKIVVAGEAPVPGSSLLRSSLTVARYNTNGSIDPTFGNNGLVQAIPQTGVPMPITSGGIAIQVDQKIVVGGVCLLGSVKELCVSRYNSNGLLDTTFDLDGLAVTDYDTFSGGAQDIVIQPDGKIVAAGFSIDDSVVDGGRAIPVLARYNENGSLDPSFGFDGRVTTFSPHQFDADAVALQSDGKIVIVGEGFNFDNFLHSVITVARYSPEGLLDETFGNAGIVMTPVGTTHAAATAVAVQADGRILAGGFGNFKNEFEVRFSDFALVRYGPPNRPPAVTITGPPSGSVFAVNTPIDFAGTFTDDEGDTHTAEWTFESITQPAMVFEPFGLTPGSVQSTHTFTEAGVYKVSLKITDNEFLSGTATTVDGLDALVVIYDPNGGFVAGGGWIDSPEGAFVLMPALTAKATFGFVSMYQNGASVPTGNTKFQFKAGDLDFHSTSYEWLVVSGRRKAQYKGVGTLNGRGGYRFMLTCVDGDQPSGGGQDKFRIRIWSDTDGLVYDNQLNAHDGDDPTTVLGGGSIVIHN